MIENTQEQKSVVVIGGGVAGMNVIYDLMKSEQPFDLTCITKEPLCDYSTCGMPFVLEGITKFEDIILHKPEFFEEKNVKLLKDTEVTGLDMPKNQIKIKNQKGESEVLDYDYLVLATGRTPFKPPISGLELNNIYTLMTYQDTEILKHAMTPGKTAVVIGGGIIGLEMAVAFNENNISTTVVELTPGVLPTMLDSDMSKLVEDWLNNKGIKILTGIKVQSINGTENVEGVRLENGETLPADIVLLSTGIRPNVELAASAGLTLGTKGGIVTDSKQHVKLNNEMVENVFAVGDCVESKNLITDQPMISALASTAILQVKVVVNNILGKPSDMLGVVNPTVTILAGLQIGSVGLTSYSAEQARLSFNSATSTGKSQSRYIPGWTNLHFKFLAQGDKLIGAQVIGETDVKERINGLAIAIHERVSINKLLSIERCYTPPLSLLTDPMNKALSKLI